MNEFSVPAGISAEEWAATPSTVREMLMAALTSIELLKQRLAELEEQRNRTSRNSSKPPSSDPPEAPKRAQKTPSGRKRGGQPGHTGHGRKLKPAEAVDRVVDIRPACCAACGTLLMGEDPDPARRQTIEIPPIKPAVVEYRQHTLPCPACGAENTPAWPAELALGSFGPRLHATVAYLTGQVHLSQREVEELLATLFHTDMALGSIPAVEQRVSEALAEPVAEAEAYVHQQPVNNVDETSWREGTQRAWLWINTTPLVTLFLILATRGTASATRILSETYQGVVGSDRWSAYNWVDPTRRQVCWAHLIRDFQAFVDRGGEPARIGTALLEQVTQMFALWYRVRDGTLSRPDFQVAMQPLQAHVGELLREGTTLSHDKTRRTCERILKIEPALWTFVRVKGVEPTNNDAERPLRRPVLWRRRSFGTQSATGSRFVERVLTTVTTLRQQERDVLGYLTAACIAAAREESPPSLLPDAPCATAVA